MKRLMIAVLFSCGVTIVAQERVTMTQQELHDFMQRHALEAAELCNQRIRSLGRTSSNTLESLGNTVAGIMLPVLFGVAIGIIITMPNRKEEDEDS